MLHAPISESKQQNAHTSAQVETPRDHELHPRLGASVMPAAGEFARGRPRWAGLHRAYGNQAVLGLLARSRPAPSPILQRACSCGGAGGECPGCKARDLGGMNPVAPPIVHEVLRSSGRPLDAATRAFMEPRFGRDLSAVRIHTGLQAAQSAKDVSALAYTVGQDIVFARGRHAPQTSEGRRLLAHELTHTIQQSQTGASSALSEGSLRLGIPGDAHERDADAIARSVTESRPEFHPPAFGRSGAALQRQDDPSTETPTFTPAPAPPVNPIIPPPPGFVPQAWICGRPLRYPGLSLFFGHAYVAAPPDNYAIIAPLCTPTDGGSDGFLSGTAARKWDNSPDPCDDDPECVICQAKSGVKDVKQCLRDAYNAYNMPTLHKATGPNSNTLAGTMARACCDGMSNATPFLSTRIYPGWGDPPAPPRAANCPSGPPQCT